jgi:hypothetical protein
MLLLFFVQGRRVRTNFLVRLGQMGQTKRKVQSLGGFMQEPNALEFTLAVVGLRGLRL